MYNKIFADSGIVLTEGSVIELLKRIYKANLNPDLLNATLIYDATSVSMQKIYLDYISIAKYRNMPMALLSPTWKANPESIIKTGYRYKNLNKDAVDYLKNLKTISGYNKILIGGLTGPKNDAYNPKESLDEKESCEFHQIQIYELYEAGADFLICSTLPSLREAKGIAKIYSKLKTDCFLSFVLNKDGNLLDGTPLPDAFRIIDEINLNGNIKYLLNCVHPEKVYNTLMKANDKKLLSGKLLGLQANASKKSPEELDNAPELLTDDIGEWVEYMLKLKTEFGLKILGGCCGTDHEYISKLADRLLL